MLEEGSVLAGMRVVGTLGRGGMGVVYRAIDERLGREVAVKLVAAQLAGVPGFRERFEAEMRIAASLEHPHVCPVYSAGETASGDLYVCMRLIEGDDLAALVGREGPLEASQAARIVTQVAAALDHAHGRTLVHRDVKPENVLVDNAGNAYLTDFGLTAEGDAGGDPADGGTLSYLAPERCQGEPALPASDQYALACLAHFLLTGAPPYVREHPAALLFAHMRQPAPSLAEYGLNRLDLPLHTALAKHPAERHPGCGAFAGALTEAVDRREPDRRDSWPDYLPRPATRLIGRERELDEIAALLDHERVRFLTLTGPGGTGKTRLALHSAARMGHLFPDAVYWAPLSQVRTAVLTLGHVARALGLRDEPDQAPLDTIADALDGRDALLVLDNCEHLLPDVAGELATLAAACPSATLLLTSRERLHLSGEHVYEVDTLDERSAVELFCSRSRAAGVPVEEAGVRELCVRLDCLPLALELAAARTPLFTPVELVERLGERLDLLKGGLDVDPRQQTLRATIDWSYDLLSDDERRVLCALSVLPGGCTYTTAETLTRATPDDLQSLIDRSLLRRRGTDSGSRYWMLETIREYAAEKLGDADETVGVVAAATRHLAEIMAELTEQAELTGDSGWERVFEADEANVLFLTRESIRRGLKEEALALATDSAIPQRDTGRARRADELLGEALDATEGLRSRMSAKALDRRSVLAHALGEYERSVVLGREALEIARELGDEERELRVIGNLGAYLTEIDAEDVAAQQYLMRAIELARSLGDDIELARASFNLADAWRDQPSKALELVSTALGIVDRTGFVVGQILCRQRLGDLHLRLDETGEACLLERESLRLCSESGRAYFAPDALEVLAVIAARHGEPVLGANLLRAAGSLRAVHGSQSPRSSNELLNQTRLALGVEQDAPTGEAPSLDRCLELADDLCGRVGTAVPMPTSP